MNKLRMTALAILFPLLLSLTAQGASWQSKKKRRGHVKKMEIVSVGRWGGNHIAMDVTSSGAQLDFDCAHATITEPIQMDANGNFNAPGLYAQEHGGPVRMGEDQDGKPAHFKGRVTGKTLTLTITLDSSSEAVGSYTLEQGKFSRIRKCM
ncbi:MAG: hypothetical protein QOF02_2993 [Blastocatellia bacterium]|jgi:hypothetical protein|nr:hypothetical protein [Blastocatellia bacterium]